MMNSHFKFFDQNPPLPDMVAEVKHGLGKSPKRISPKYFYDERGSALFDQITELPEYYLTRTEISILRERKQELANIVGPSCCLIEYGSGSSKKVRLLIDALQPRYYVPIDISKTHLNSAAAAIYQEFDELSVYPTCADFTDQFHLPDVIDGAPRCGFFPGSSIGNFERDDAVRFVASLRAQLGTGGHCVIGFDSRKQKRDLEPAYNDAAGVTALFNLNLLQHLNATVGTNFDVTRFRHKAIYNEAIGRIEMYLVSDTDQEISLDGETFRFKSGEPIHTENSYKYSLDEVKHLAKQAGMRFIKHWQDDRARFFVVLLQVPVSS